MKITKGQIVEGIVTGIKPYGAFIKLDNETVGLAFIEDLSVVRIKSPEERLNIGQHVKCMVKSINEETGKINLSYKDCLGTWEENIENFKEGTTVKGIVRDAEKNKNGIFIELAPNLVGMTEYNDSLQYGQNVNVYIKKIVPDKKKVKLVIV